MIHKIIKRKADDEVIGFLKKNKIQNLNIFGYLDNNPDAVVFVYGSDIDDGVIVSNSELDHFLIDTENTDFLKEFWVGLPRGHKCFSGVPEHIAEMIIKIAGKPVWRNKCNVFVLTGGFQYEPDNRFERFCLTTADAREVDDFYTYKSEDSYGRILESIEKRDSEALKIDGELAAWVLVHDDNSIGPLYVKEKFRGRRLAKIISERLICKLIAKNIIPFGHIVQGNEASHANMKRINGMELSHVCDWFGIEKI